MKKNKEIRSYLDLSSRIQKKIIKEAVKSSNDEQLKMVNEYNRRFGSAKVGS